MAKAVEAEMGSIDVLFNNGGISQRGHASETEESVDRKIMEVNYFGTIALTKAVLPIMRKQGSGHILVTSSLVGIFGFSLRSAYAASKHALHGFFESLRMEEKANNIKVTMICPGRIKTEISKSALTKDGKEYGALDPGQQNGMLVEDCAKQIVKATKRNGKEVVIGSLAERIGVLLNRFIPSLFWVLIAKQAAK